MSIKTNKSLTKRLKITKNGKILSRAPGFNHFNAKQSRTNIERISLYKPKDSVSAEVQRSLKPKTHLGTQELMLSPTEKTRKLMLEVSGQHASMLQSDHTLDLTVSSSMA